MTNPYYNHSSAAPVAQSRGTSPVMRQEFDAIAAGFTAVNGAILSTQIATNVLQYGADNTGVLDSLAAFNLGQAAVGTDGQILVPAGIYKLSANTSADTTWIVDAGATFTGPGRMGGRIIQQGTTPLGWIYSEYSGKYSYLGSNATQWLQNRAGNSVGGSISYFGATRTADGGGSAGEAWIGVGALAINDYAGAGAGTRASNTWGFYGTLVRSAVNGSGTQVTGSTIGMEIDIANLGDVVSLLPVQPFQSGLTVGLALAAGGEMADTQTAGTSSAALTIVANYARDPGDYTLPKYPPAPSWEKGIVFHDHAIYGANGTTGTGVAIAFARGHLLQWYKTDGAGIGYIANQVDTTNLASNISVADTGFSILGAANQYMLNVSPLVNAVNYLQISPGLTTAGPTLKAQGEANINLNLSANGTGKVTSAYPFKSTNPLAFEATASNAGIELGAVGTANAPHVDFHSSASSTDYDVRIGSTGGSGSAGAGLLTIEAARAQFNLSSYRINADFTGTGPGDRVAFQSSAGNGISVVQVLPNGSATTTSIQARNNQDPANSSVMSIGIDTLNATIGSSQNGSGSYLPLVISTNGSPVVTLTTAHNMHIGPLANTSAAATAGVINALMMDKCTTDPAAGTTHGGAIWANDVGLYAIGPTGIKRTLATW